jgi:hypothetical protein
VTDAMRVHGLAMAKWPAGKQERRNGPVEVTQIDKRVLKHALKLAGGDARRLRIMKDGSVLVT